MNIHSTHLQKTLRRPGIKRWILICFTMLWASITWAQEETLLKGDIRESGGFGGPVVKTAQVRGVTSLLLGGRGGWIINKTYVIGAGGYGLVTRVELEKLGPDTTRYLEFGYGGLEFEYVSQSDKLIHWTFYTLLGFGGVQYRDRSNKTPENGEGVSGQGDEVFVLEPGINAEMNITKFFRLNFGASYRAVVDTDLPLISNKDLSGVNAILTLKFGKF